MPRAPHGMVKRRKRTLNQNILIVNSSPLEKLRIIAYTDPKYQSEAGKEYEALVNPEEFVEHFKIEYNTTQGEGTTGAALKFQQKPPPEITLHLIFDATGALNYEAGLVNLSEKPEPLEEQLNRFKEVIKGYDGTIHSTYYLKIVWGVLIFYGKLTGLDVKYTVFKPDGKPMRAHVKATFLEFKDDEKRANEQGKNSPDLTHIRTVKAGDTLPLMTHRIYGDFSYYLEVARVNKLKDYRNLKPGTRIVFPPLDKTTVL